MTFIPKPRVRHPKLEKNAVGLTQRDYEGVLSTLCAGCGHDSVTAAIVQAAYELDLPPHTVAKTSGIGCSSKTPAYFLGPAHGFNSVHGRMPSITTGANLAQSSLLYLGVSGDGDTGSIGIGQFIHAMRRKLNMLYVIENNGAYGLTKGQFSAMADIGSKSKGGEANLFTPIDAVSLAIEMGASFVARSFSGDKDQLVPLIKAGLKHKGFSLIDVLSPCVTFNNHDGSTKSYNYIRQHEDEVVHADYVAYQEEITTQYKEGETQDVTLHDGGTVRLYKLHQNYDPTDRMGALQYLRNKRSTGEIVTGLVYMDKESSDLHDVINTVKEPLRDIAFEKLCPGAKALEDIMSASR